MIVALLQLSLQAENRAANIQGLTAGIDRAAAINPPPDLLILPGACDTGGTLLEDGLSNAALRCLAETIAFKAREWGVFIAAGLHQCRRDALEPGAALFDPDGDIVARSPGLAAPPDETGTAPVELWSSAVGDLGVAHPQMDARPADGLAVGGHAAFIAWPVATVLGGQRRALIAALDSLREGISATGGAYWGVAIAAKAPSRRSREHSLCSFVCGPDGQVLASAPDTNEAIFYSEVPLLPAPATSGEGFSTHGDHAD